MHKIVNLINGYMRSPKIEALHRTITWLNNYIENNKNNKNNSSNYISMGIARSLSYTKLLGLSNAPISSNAWLAGFIDADANFSITLSKRSSGLIRVTPIFRIELGYLYTNNNTCSNYLQLLELIANNFRLKVYARDKEVKGKLYSAILAMNSSISDTRSVIDYLSNFPLLSNKRLDYLSWLTIVDMKLLGALNSEVVEKAKIVRQDFNSTRYTFNKDHLERDPLSD